MLTHSSPMFSIYTPGKTRKNSIFGYLLYSDYIWASTKIYFVKNFLKLKQSFVIVSISLWFSLCLLKTGAVVRRFSVKSIIKNFAKSSATLLKKRLRHWCLSVNFVKFLRTLFLQCTYEQLLLQRYFYV